MAIYHFSAKVISRAAGSSALAAAAYRSASRLHDQRLDRDHDFSSKAGVEHSEVLLPDGAPEHLRYRERLWNDVEAGEVRKDAQLAREVEFAIPRELDSAEGIRLAREFVKAEFVDRGMIADLNVHRDVGPDGMVKPHAHVMLTMRSVDENGFGAKMREWNRTDLLDHWREAWAQHVNHRLVELDIDASVDHRSLEAQGIDLEPQHKIGPAASRMVEQGRSSERLDEHRDIARENGDRLLARPELALDAITHQQSTFTTRDLAMFVHRHSDGKEQFDHVMAAVRGSPELVKLGKDGRGQERFTSRDMLETERRLEIATEALARQRGHGLAERTIGGTLARSASAGLVLGEMQEAALRHVTRDTGLATVVGYAGTGKSAMLSVARDGWEQEGYRVVGAALSGIAAENLEHGSGITSRTLASLEHQWEQDRDLLTSRDVLVIDEAGMIGTRQMERVIAESRKRGAKVVLVGDPEQLQAIEAGAAFRSVAERHGSVEITEVRRQRADWQRDATRQLATGRTGLAISAYDEHGHIHAAETREQARRALIARWDRDCDRSLEASRIILTHTNAEVRELNLAARASLREVEALGEDVTLQTEKGERRFASGDRVMFLRNERSLGVKNGSLGTVHSVSRSRMAVILDDDRAVALDVKDYAAIDHGYAATVHKAQGMTVDRVHVLATPGLDRHAAYVALSRHRDSVDLHYGRDDFADRSKLVRALSRERAKDMASDHLRTPEREQAKQPTKRRSMFDGLKINRDMVEKVIPTPSHDPFAGLDLRPAAPPMTRGMFDGLKLDASPAPGIEPPGLGSAVQRFARATADIMRMRRDGYRELPHQTAALDKARAALEAVRPHAARDLGEAFARDAGLADEAAKGRTSAAIRAMTLETEMRASPERRADRFVEDWTKLATAHRRLDRAGDSKGARAIGQQMTAMGKSMERDAQAESLVRKRLPELGLAPHQGASLSHSIQNWLGHSRSRGLGR
ncbi:Ti-type conjugative transfer relaxase TraA [Stakelama saccharophila]|uniref:Ti-type conjugative transfer relaxase TraA n=1 Tax=Stakelama saccharophila TaxID=3075605 RepID=A0ABZ0B899_9SPHN|nr:Ti-type conjugative transfer relaxase TraA [Stakelama sp. W311]WNO53624.1 Ti-type conjugative transfer relaxase TraA [Stakelama sp. W311]